MTPLVKTKPTTSQMTSCVPSCSMLRHNSFFHPKGVRFLYLMPSVVEIWMSGDVSWTCYNAMLRKAKREKDDVQTGGDEGMKGF